MVELLGGKVRDTVPYSGYLFFKPAVHDPDPGYEPDRWGEAMDAEGIVAQARRMVDGYGFKSLKLKGGVLPPSEEANAILALRDAFPEHPLRLDPNAGWTVESSIAVGKKLDGVLEYLEDPTGGIDGMAAVAREVSMPLATNMCVTALQPSPARREGRCRSGGALGPPLLGWVASFARTGRDLPGPSGSACRCTRTHTSASAWRR